jgi:NAD(P)-dependent dehydrogenase (short-subunit alcohol dehydrogenase family)
MNRLEGKVAVITGAASGIGAATTRLFLEEGACVVLADIQKERGEQMAEELGTKAAFHHTNVATEDGIAGAVDLAVSKFGRLDCMFNNAGFGGESNPIADTDFQGMKDTVDVLLNGVIMGMKHATRVMRPQGSGSIVSTASVAGIGVGYGGHIYSACKAAIIHLTRSVANEVGEDGIRVNAVAPGAIPTAIFGRGMGMDQAGAESIIPMLEMGMAKAQPIQRTGKPLDIAEAVLWLASDAASFVTAQTIAVDGGITTGKLWSQKIAEMSGAR